MPEVIRKMKAGGDLVLTVHFLLLDIRLQSMTFIRKSAKLFYSV